ncbi:MAG: hypothetical protein AB8G77_24530 [Rhodothermales bacterium]
MNQKNENDVPKRSPLSYELIVRNNKTPQEHGAPHLILRRQLKDKDQQKKIDVSVPENAEQVIEDDAAEIASADSVADYISSLHYHVADDVARVVDAIIEEEGKMPSNLPKLDDKLTMIFPGSDVQGSSDDDLFFERKEAQPADSKASKYTNRVEYEDL